jgi:hypothetical protein
MKKIEKQVIEQDALIKKQGNSLREKVNSTITIDGIDERIELRMIKFFQKEIRKTSKNQGRKMMNVNFNSLDDTQAIFQDIN